MWTMCRGLSDRRVEVTAGIFIGAGNEPERNQCFEHGKKEKEKQKINVESRLTFGLKRVTCLEANYGC